MKLTGFPVSEAAPECATFSSSYVLFTPVDHVREVYARYAAGDWSGVLSLLSPFVEFVFADDLPWGGRFVGHEAVKRLHLRLSRRVEAALVPVSYAPVSTDIAVTGRFRGLARASGRRFDVDFVQVWTIAKGRVMRCATFIDTPAMLRALAPR